MLKCNTQTPPFVRKFIVGSPNMGSYCAVVTGTIQSCVFFSFPFIIFVMFSASGVTRSGDDDVDV